MNNRDPFNNLRRISGPAIAVLKSSATTLEDRACEVVERGRNVLNQVTTETQSAMSAYAPNVQNGWPTQRHPDLTAGQSHYVSSAHTQTNGSITERVSGIFGAEKRDELPMYKDKPTSHRAGKGYGYPSRRRKHPWFLQRRTIALLLTSLGAISWWFGILSPLSWFTSGSRRSPSASTWEARAEQVKETFKISFAGYEKHAWGTDRQ